MQVAPITAIANYNGKNPGFRADLVKSEKNEPGGGRTFQEIFEAAKRKCK